MINLEYHADTVIQVISEFMYHFNLELGFSPMKHQIKLFSAKGESNFLDSNLDRYGFTIRDVASFNEF